jgi:hypothetical protein
MNVVGMSGRHLRTS